MAQVNLGHVVGPGVPTGGTANQVLVKNGSTNFDTSWKDAGTIPSIANVQDGLAIVSNGNTHAAIASGQFVYVKNHSSLGEGLYRATTAISANGALSTSNLTADSVGGLNAMKADVDTLNSKMTPETVTVINGACYLSAIDKICILNIGGSIQAPTGSQTTIATLDTNYRPTRTTYGVVSIEGGSSNKYALVAITAGGVITIYNYSGTSANYLYGSIMFVR